jgi:hypothetical protein
MEAMRESWTDERMMLQFGAGALVTFAVGFASLIVAQL